MTLQSSHTRWIAAVTVSCGLAATTAHAQSRGHMRFAELDLNHDGVISHNEWRASDRDFRLYDLNGDGVISSRELRGQNQTSDDRQTATSRSNGNADRSQATRPISRAFEAGRQRGLEEGRQAGREDSYRRRWDLDGQQELVDANSGYRSDLGPLEEFQAGYREAFMTAYREGFGSNAPRHGNAYRAGQTRGLADGREAGREDASRSQWDLEGQQELLLADAGYREDLGSRSDYQEGYRSGFRQGYGDAFGTHRY
jgi:hypothetical protein